MSRCDGRVRRHCSYEHVRRERTLGVGFEMFDQGFVGIRPNEQFDTLVAPGLNALR